ncbi:MAG: 50S ribosomal protein L23 [Candidatus Altiarchaeota archaeon]
MNPHEIILYPLMGEKATTLREKANTLTFIVNKKSGKKEVKNAVEEMLNVKVVSVNVMHTTDGKKKAHVKIDSSQSAEEIASQLGVL